MISSYHLDLLIRAWCERATRAWGHVSHTRSAVREYARATAIVCTARAELARAYRDRATLREKMYQDAGA